NKVFTCQATIQELVLGYFHACIECKNDIKNCPAICNGDGTTKPTFKLTIGVGDQTGDTTFVAFGAVATKLRNYAGIPEQLQICDPSKEEGRPHLIKKQFQQLHGKKFVFKIKVDDHNVRHKREGFKIKKIQQSDVPEARENYITKVKKEPEDENSNDEVISDEDENSNDELISDEDENAEKSEMERKIKKEKKEPTEREDKFKRPRRQY
ncbi:hypothetical protein MKX03_019100, partial [Papaver bracteatum]